MRYKPKSSAGFHIALGGLPAQTRVEVDPGIDVSLPPRSGSRHSGAARFLAEHWEA
jgi:hypothetical protein